MARLLAAVRMIEVRIVGDDDLDKKPIKIRVYYHAGEYHWDLGPCIDANRVLEYGAPAPNPSSLPRTASRRGVLLSASSCGRFSPMCHYTFHAPESTHTTQWCWKSARKGSPPHPCKRTSILLVQRGSGTYTMGPVMRGCQLVELEPGMPELEALTPEERARSVAWPLGSLHRGTPELSYTTIVDVRSASRTLPATRRRPPAPA